MNDLDRFLNGELEEEQMEKMTKDIIYQQLDQETRQRWDQLLRERHGLERPAPAKQAVQRRLWPIIAAAASVALLVGLFFWLNDQGQPEYQQLAETYVETLPIMADQLVFRKGEEGAEELRVKAYEAYTEGDFSAAATAWEQLQAAGDLNAYDQFYWAASSLRRSPAESTLAIQLLQQAQQGAPDLQQEIDWVLSLAYILNDQPESARPILQQIVTNRQYMSASAAPLLESLENENIQ